MRCENKLNFTTTSLSNIPTPDINEKKRIYYDTKQLGLALIVSYGGSKTFYLYSSYNYRMHILKVGHFPEMSIEDARSKVLGYKHDIQENIDPKDEREKIKKDKTLREFFESEYLPKHAQVRKKPGTWKQDIRTFNMYCKPIERKKMLAITRLDVENIHRTLGVSRSHQTANHWLALVRHMLNMAVEWGFIEINPATRIKQFRLKSRERFLQTEELQRFFTALNNELDSDVKDFILLLLFTGQRRSNVSSLKWNYIDFHNKLMFLPETKNGESQHIPLTEQALKSFQRLKDSSEGKSEWIFPSKRSNSGHLEYPEKFWKNLLKKSNITNLHMHDLRRTMGSYQAITGSSLHIIGKSLGHKSEQSTAIYARLSLAPVRESMQKAVNEMELYR